MNSTTIINMYKTFLILLLILSSCCTSAPKEEQPLKKDSTGNKNKIMPIKDNCIPSAYETEAPSQNDIDLFISQRGKNYELIKMKIDYGSHRKEVLLYSLIAANKFQINQANYDIASILSDIFSKTDVGKHSKEMVLHFFDKAKSSRMRTSQIEHFKKMEDTGEDLFDTKRNNIEYIETIKAEVVKGNSHSYDDLKKTLVENEEDYLLYYAYLMSDRYGYAPARKDIISVIEKAFKKYKLGAIDPETQYFIDMTTKE